MTYPRAAEEISIQHGREEAIRHHQETVPCAALAESTKQKKGPIFKAFSTSDVLWALFLNHL